MASGFGFGGGLPAGFSGDPNGLRRSVIDPVTGQPVITSAPTGEIVQRADLLPFGVNDAGRLRPAVPQMALDAVKLAGWPGRVASGQETVFDPATGHVSDDAVEKAFNFAGGVGAGGYVSPKPAGALGMFGGRNAKTADLEALGRAEGLAAKGADRQAIWDDTGWFQGADQKWRFEIPDNQSKVLPGLRKTPAGEPAALATGFRHSDLYEAYPEFASAEVRTGRFPRNSSHAFGAYFIDKDMIALNNRHPSFKKNDGTRSLLLHEAQHRLQSQEGFAQGDSPSRIASASLDPSLVAAREAQAAAQQAGNSTAQQAAEAALRRAAQDLYRRSAGEVEARNVEIRRNMSPDLRQMYPPWRTQDVPDEQQIVRFGEVGPQMSAETRAARDVEQLRSALDAEHPSISYHLNERSGGPLTVSKVIVPPEMRGKGEGTRFMRDVLDYADANARTVALSPDASFGGRLGALRDWYSSLGFVPNKGRNRDFEVSESMYRRPFGFGPPL